MQSTAFASLRPGTALVPQQSRAWCGVAAARARVGERALGVDYGLRRVGLAVSVGFAPRPLARVEHERDAAAAAHSVARVADGVLAGTVVVGLPLNASGSEGEQAFATRMFCMELAKAAPWAKIVLLDERYTSQDARDTLLEAGVRPRDVAALIDSACAVSILDRFFSDGDDAPPIVFHTPAEGMSHEAAHTLPKTRASQISFAAWKAQAQAQAQTQANASGSRSTGKWRRRKQEQKREQNIHPNVNPPDPT